MDRQVTAPALDLPTATDAEAQLLGCLLHDNEQAWLVRGTLTADDFYEPRHAAVYSAVLRCLDSGQPADLVTLVPLLQGGPGKPGATAQVLSGLMEAAYSGERAEAYAALVRDAAARRRLIAGAHRAAEAARKTGLPVGDALHTAEAELLRVLEHRPSPAVRPAAAVVADLERTLAQPVQKRALLKTGYADLDQKLGGLAPGSLTVLAARPSMGKTSLATSILQNVAVTRGLPALMFSLEMSDDQIVQNMACAIARLPNTAVRDRTLDGAAKAQLAGALARLAKAPLRIDDTAGIDIAQVRATIRIEKARSDLALVIVDYLQLVHGDSRAESREREVAGISATLKQTARECDVAILALSQLNRVVESRKAKQPTIADLRDSGAIEQDADVVMLLHRLDYYKPSLTAAGHGSETTICIGKNRNGPTGNVKLLFFKEWTRFESAAPPDLSQLAGVPT